MGRSDFATARAGFDALSTTFHGELAPTLALDVTAECAGDDNLAERYYARVVTVDPSWSDAAFGLARTRLRTDARSAAFDALHAIPMSSSGYVAGQLATVEALVLDPSYRGTEVERTAAGLPCPLAWHPGYRLSVEQLRRRPGFRGPQFVRLGERIAVEGFLDPRIVGRAARSVARAVSRALGSRASSSATP